MTCYSDVRQFDTWNIIVIVICGLLFLFIVICAIIKVIMVILVSRQIMRSLRKLFPYNYTVFLFYLWLPGICRGETMGVTTGGS